ncbi:MAG: IS5/IS1182 family transposase, partial [Porticoccaceae bacterium]
CRLKEFRRIATRYDKLASRFSAFIALVASFVWLA